MKPAKGTTRKAKALPRGLYLRDDSDEIWMNLKVDGRPRIRRSTGRKRDDIKGAENVLAQARLDLLNKTQFGWKEDVSLQELFEIALDRVKKTHNTWLSYELVMRQTLGLGDYAKDGKHGAGWYHWPQHIQAHEVTPKLIRELIRRREKHGHSDNTINNTLRVLKLVIKGAPEDLNVPRDLKFPMREPFQKSRFLSDAEEQQVLDYLKERRSGRAYDKAYTLFMFLIETGIRVGDALALPWKKVIVQSETPHVLVYARKTRSDYTVGLTEAAIEAVQHNRSRGYKKPFPEMTRAVKLLRAVIHRIGDQDPEQVAKEGRATIHSLRDTFASRLVQANVSLHKVGKVLNQKTQNITAKYGHLVPSDVAEEQRQILNARRKRFAG